MESLKDKVVIVTGSSTGIGAATAVQFSKYGCKVVITGRNEQKLANVSDLCEAASPSKYKPLSVAGDIGNENFHEVLINAAIEKHGQLDVLVNNAGVDQLADILSDEFPKAYEYQMNINVRSPLMLIRLALPRLIESKGCVITTSSVVSTRWLCDNNVVYTMTKAAVDAMTRSLAHEFGPKGVRVLTVNPGVVKSTIMESMNLPDTLYDVLTKDYPLRRPGNTDEIANVICFLASSGASFMTGTHVVVDGGHSVM